MYPTPEVAEQGGFAAAKFVVFTNQPGDNPFMAGAVHGLGQHEVVINVGVSGPGVVKKELERALKSGRKLTLGDLSEIIKKTSFRVTRVGELIAREVAQELGVPFGIVDLSLAPTPTVGDSVGEILKTLGISRIGAPGSTAAVAMLNDAVKKGGLFASSSVGGLSGAFIPVSEDAALAEAVGEGHLVLEKLEAMTAVCSVGLDMIAVPGDTPPETIAAIIADEMAIGVINDKTTAVRLIPVPGAKAGDRRTVTVDFPANFVTPQLAGRKGVYEVEVVEIKERVLPGVVDHPLDHERAAPRYHVQYAPLGLEPVHQLVLLIRVEAFVQAACGNEDILPEGEVTEDQFRVVGTPYPAGTTVAVANTPPAERRRQRHAERLLQRTVLGRGKGRTADNRHSRIGKMVCEPVKIVRIDERIVVEKVEDVAPGSGCRQIPLAAGPRPLRNDDLVAVRRAAGRPQRLKRPDRAARLDRNDDGDRHKDRNWGLGTGDW